MTELHRRSFLKALLFATIGGAGTACSKLTQSERGSLIHVPPGQSVARFPEKTELILLTDRPPQLETPLFYYRQDLTPNEAFFVRWHFAGIPSSVDLETFRLNIDGLVDSSLSLSVADLKKNFESHETVAVVQCSGNSRRYFEPQVPGGQWQNGALGNAKWTGVKLKDILAKAGVKKGAVEVSFAGLDEPPLSNMPKFAKSLAIEHAMEDEILVAYQMNDADLPMVNGFPLRLVVPGYFATYWVKALNQINVLPSKFDGFWMEKSYRIPDNEFAEEAPKELAKNTVPINKLNVRSLFVRPDTADLVRAGREFPVEGIAFDAGSGIAKVEINISKSSKNGGANGSDKNDGSTKQEWKQTTLLENSLGKFSWYRWRYQWLPTEAGEYIISVKATNVKGDAQSAKQHWNKSGYMRNSIEQLTVQVI